MSMLAGLRRKLKTVTPANAANPAIPGRQTRKISEISKGSRSDKDANDNPARIAALQVKRLEKAKRRCRARARLVTRMLRRNSQLTHAYYTDDHDPSQPDYVILALAIRGVGTCDLSIEREKYDPFTLLDVISRGHSQ